MLCASIQPGCRFTFAKLAIANLPKDILVSVDQRIPGGLDLEEWALLRRVLGLIKKSAPAGSSFVSLGVASGTLGHCPPEYGANLNMRPGPAASRRDLAGAELGSNGGGAHMSRRLYVANDGQ